MRTYKLQHKFSNYFGNYNSSSKSGMSSIHACPVFNLRSPLHISIIFHQVPDISRKMPKDSKGLEIHLFNLLPTSQNQSKSPKIATLAWICLRGFPPKKKNFTIDSPNGGFPIGKIKNHPKPSPAIPSHRLLSSKLSDGLLQITQIFTRHAVQGFELQCQATAETLHHGHLMRFKGGSMAEEREKREPIYMYDMYHIPVQIRGEVSHPASCKHKMVGF